MATHDPMLTGLFRDRDSAERAYQSISDRGYSRDDVNSFLPDYLKKEILERDPFQSIDTGGVGKLMDMAVKKGRSTRPDLKCGICGEHGGDPKSVEFCHSIKLNYVSCSPFRVPIARLAAAHAAIKQSAESRKPTSKKK